MHLGNGSDQATLEYTLKYNPPMDLAVAERNLKEIKGILEGLGVVFLLGSGSCLGAVRDKAFIPWDDDVDLLTVIGTNGLTEKLVDAAVEEFREKGYFVGEMDAPRSTTKMTVKDHVRISLEAVRIYDDHLYSYPGIALPAAMFTHPKEIEFLAERFNVPNPPEEYLRLKYGAEVDGPQEVRGVREGRCGEDFGWGGDRPAMLAQGAGPERPAGVRGRGDPGGLRPLLDRPAGICRDNPAKSHLVRPGHQVPGTRGGPVHGGVGAEQDIRCTAPTPYPGHGASRQERWAQSATSFHRSEPGPRGRSAARIGSAS